MLENKAERLAKLLLDRNCLKRPVFFFFLETLDFSHVLLELFPEVYHGPLPIV